MDAIHFRFMTDSKHHYFVTSNTAYAYIQQKILKLLGIPYEIFIPDMSDLFLYNTEPLDVRPNETKKVKCGIYQIGDTYYRVMGTAKKIPIFCFKRDQEHPIIKHTITVYGAFSSTNKHVALSLEALNHPSAKLVATVTKWGKWVSVGDRVSYLGYEMTITEIDKFHTGRITIADGTAVFNLLLDSVILPDNVGFPFGVAVKTYGNSTVPFGRVSVFDGYNPYKGHPSFDQVDAIVEAKALSKISLLLAEHRNAVVQDAKVLVDCKGVTFYNDDYTRTIQLPIFNLTVGPTYARNISFYYSKDGLGITVKVSAMCKVS